MHTATHRLDATASARGGGADAAPPLDIEALRRDLQASTGREVRCVETHISWVLLDG